MSLRGSDFRCELDPELYEALRKIARHRKTHAHLLGAELLEKAIAGEAHMFRLMLDDLASSGILRRPADKSGK